MRDENGDWQPYQPIGSNLTPSQRRMTPVDEPRKQTHALEHIAQVLDRIDAKLDALLAERGKTDKP